MDRFRTEIVLCRHERCPIVEAHQAHDEDFQRRPRKRRTKTQQAVAAGRPRVVQRITTDAGPMAYVKCPECNGGGCIECQETGRMSLFRWHLWKRESGG